jgi:hypothetical protein
MTRPATPKKAIRKGANSSPSRGKITVDFFVFKNSFSFWGLSFFIGNRKPYSRKEFGEIYPDYKTAS